MDETITADRGLAAVEASKQQPVMRQRQRNPLACTDCRKRKSKCDGRRPNCSSCVGLRLSCLYKEVSPERRVKQRKEDCSEAQLRRKIKVLEAKLQSRSEASPIEQFRYENNTVAETRGTHTPRSTSICLQAAATEALQEARQSTLETSNEQVAEEEVTVDVLATAAFNTEPQLNIGHFGPSSNHGMFRTLSDIFAHTARSSAPIQNTSVDRWAKSHHRLAQSRCTTPPGEPESNTSERIRYPTDANILPCEKDAFVLFNHFFSSVGLVLPFIRKSELLSEYHRARENKFENLSRVSRARFNIIFAHSSQSLGASSPETFYLRALALLDEQTLRGTSQQMVQTLLLLCVFQQNNQRSVSSWTLHALAVKASLQCGLHSPASYIRLAWEECEVRRRLWYSVICQDRILSMTFGQPCLIPPAHVRVDIPQDQRSLPHVLPRLNLDGVDSFVYFNQMVSLCNIVGSVIESLYDYNLEALRPPNMQEEITQTLRFSWAIEECRHSMPSFCNILTTSDLTQRPTKAYDAMRYQILLSIQYYRAVLLVNFPILASFLRELVKERRNEREFEFLRDSALPVLKKDFIAARELQGIVNAISTSPEPFLDRNAAWWMCNYAIFTVDLHLFGILLACHHCQSLLANFDLNAADVRIALDNGLQTLGVLERTSLMSQKARICLSGFLEVFDTLTAEQHPTPSNFDAVTMPIFSSVNSTGDSSSFEMFPNDLMMAEDYISQYIAQSTNDFLLQCSHNDLFDLGAGFVGSLP